MTTINLDKLFAPKSVAVIGASNRLTAVGSVVMQNLLQGGFNGPIFPVNPRHQSVRGVLAYPDIEHLPMVPDLAVICTPPDMVVGALEALGEKGTRAVICLTTGLNNLLGEDGRPINDTVQNIIQHYGMRLLGPNCVGLIVPRMGLNASFAHGGTYPGKIAFVSQSGAISTAVLDWARTHGIGFSHFMSIGDALDLDFGDIIDFLGSDPYTRAILLYMESIRERRNFMSAARAAARNKPVVVIKAGRNEAGAAAAKSHTGAMAGSDDVYDAAIRRAGMLRVYDFKELFSAVETLARIKDLRGPKLAIMTSGGGLGVMAVDSLIELGGQMAVLSHETVEKLSTVLPATWSKVNPIDIVGDADAERYGKAAKILAHAPEVDAVLILHAPVATTSPTETARAVIEAVHKSRATVLTSWVGADSVRPARDLFSEANLPTYDTPTEAVHAFMQMVRYRKNQEMLMETPGVSSQAVIPDTDKVRHLIDEALNRGDEWLAEPEAKSLLAAYGLPVIEAFAVTTPAEAAAKATEIGFPVALKILSPNILHKSDCGGVDLHLSSAKVVEDSAQDMLETIKRVQPDAVIKGFTVQKMAERPGAHELIIGVKTDLIFGPVILFGHGGTAVEVIGDSAIALPPLNKTLAREVISRTRVERLLLGYRDHLPVDMDKLCDALMQISQLIVDVPEIQELDINPLFSDEHGVLALDARIRVAHTSQSAHGRLAIRPYPRLLEEEFTMKSGRTVLLRPIRPEDEPEHHEFVSKLSPEDIRFRFFGSIRELPHSEMARLTQIDYDREMAFIATALNEDGEPETLGVVRTVTDPNNETAEYAIIIRSDLKGEGLGRKMMDKMIAYCRARGTRYYVGQVLRSNQPMLGLVEYLGFEIHRVPDEEDIKEVKLLLNP